MTKRATTSQQAVVPGLGKRLALNLASGVLPEAGGVASVPEWIEVLPAGPEIAGRDGRYWIADDPSRIVSDSLAGGPLHVDYEHASEVRAPQGEPAPAAGWIDKLETRDGGAIWAHVEWTPRARQMIADREYRYISPVFYFDKDSLAILNLVSAALTNKPNLTMTALNRRDAAPTKQTEERPRMDKEQMKALCRKLGLADEASPEAIMSAVEALKADKDKALNAAQSPALDKFVPRTDYDKVKGDLDVATNSLKKIETDKREADIVAAVDGAVSAGKIAPASKDFYLATCRKDGGLDEFKKFVTTAPVLTTGTDLDKKPASGGASGELTADEKAVCSAMGLSEDQFKKAR